MIIIIYYQRAILVSQNKSCNKLERKTVHLATVLCAGVAVDLGEAYLPLLAQESNFVIKNILSFFRNLACSCISRFLIFPFFFLLVSEQFCEFPKGSSI